MKKAFKIKKRNKIKKGPRTKTGKAVVAHARKIKAAPLHRKKRQLKLAGVILLVEIVVLLATALNIYHNKPGVIERDSLKATKAGTDYIQLEWEETRNTDAYTLIYRSKGYKDEDSGTLVPSGEWVEITVDSQIEDDDSVSDLEENGKRIKASYRLTGLEENRSYEVKLRAEGDSEEGFETDAKTFATKLSQTITARDNITKLTCSDSFNIEASAGSKIHYSSSDTTVAEVNKYSGKVEIKGAGTTTITLEAEGTKLYLSATKDITLTVYSSGPVSVSGAKCKIIGTLDDSNCEAIKAVSGDGSIHVPQGLAYTGDKYIIAYGMSGSQRIISFDADGDGKDISVPDIALGHPNGFTYSPDLGLCYCVKGWSTRAVTYNPTTGEYGTINFKYGCSGIAYDRIDKVFYTSSRTAMRVYSGDGKYTHEKVVGVVSHSGHTYTQDIGGHAGIMMRCLSGSSKHGTNYIDLYDMRNGNYLGTFSCELSEVESCVVDDEGYMVILANNSSKTDYIWRTNINIEDISEGL